MSLIETFKDFNPERVRTASVRKAEVFISAVSPLLEKPSDSAAYLKYYDYLGTIGTALTPPEKIIETNRIKNNENGFRDKVLGFIGRFVARQERMLKPWKEASIIANDNTLPEVVREGILEREYSKLTNHKEIARIEIVKQVAVAVVTKVKEEKKEETKITPEKKLPKTIDGREIASDEDLAVLLDMFIPSHKGKSEKGVLRNSTREAEIFRLIADKNNKGGISTKDIMNVFKYSNSGAVANFIGILRRTLAESKLNYQIYSTEGKRGVHSLYYIVSSSVEEGKKEEKVEKKDEPKEEIKIKELSPDDKKLKTLTELFDEDIEEAIREGEGYLKDRNTSETLRNKVKVLVSEWKSALQVSEELGSGVVDDKEKGKLQGRSFEDIFSNGEVIKLRSDIPIKAFDIPWEFQDRDLSGAELKSGVLFAFNFPTHANIILGIMENFKRSKFRDFSQLKSLISKFGGINNPIDIRKGERVFNDHSNILVHSIGGPNGLRIYYTPIIRLGKRILVVHAISDYNNLKRVERNLNTSITKARNSASKKGLL